MECRIRVRGHLGPAWGDRLAGLRVAHEGGGVSLLTSPLPDQAALHGVLLRLFDLGLPLVSLDTAEVPPRDRTIGSRGPPNAGMTASGPPELGGATRGGRGTSPAVS